MSYAKEISMNELLLINSNITFGVCIAGIIFVSYVLGQRNAKEAEVEGIVDLVITKLCHEGYIHYEEMDDGDYDLIKIKDYDNGSA